VFGGSPVQPSELEYKAYAISANTTLTWPLVTSQSDNPFAREMDVSASVASLNLVMPDATLVSTGMSTAVKNTGANSFTLQDSTGGTIAAVATGETKYIYLTDNSTAAGTWGVYTLGTGTSGADASALAGYGLVAISNKLNINAPVTTLVANYTVQTSDRGATLVWNAGVGTISLMAAASYTPNGFEFGFLNLGTGAVTVDPNGAETINEASTLTVNPGESCIISTDLTSWYAVGQGRSTTFAWSLLNKSVAGSSNVTLTSTEAANGIMFFTGLLTGNIDVIVPSAVNEWTVYNNTTGAFSLTVKTAAGTGVAITQGEKRILFSDGTNVYLADDGTASSTGLFPDGSASAPSIAFTSQPSYGLYLATNYAVGVAAGGVQQALFATGSLSVTGPVYNATGSVSSPSYSFTTATQMGMYASATNVLGFSLNGAAALTLASSNANFQQTPVGNYSDLTQSYTATGNITLNGATAGLIHVVTMTATSTITLPVLTIASGSEMTLEVQIVENGTGGFTPTFAADAGNSLVWSNATSQPAANTNANKETDYSFRRRGGATIWRSSQVWIDP
jgi:predicted secreted protein